jgi:hypothetical protein
MTRKPGAEAQAAPMSLSRPHEGARKAEGGRAATFSQYAHKRSVDEKEGSLLAREILQGHPAGRETVAKTRIGFAWKRIVRETGVAHARPSADLLAAAPPRPANQ